ncbi:MAG: cytochrome P450 [Legionellaceae bacterium]|nr:cytochrome P450 [Legionellaceae bacterium]
MAETTLPKGPPKKNLLQYIKYIAYPVTIWEECRQIYGKTFTLRFSTRKNMVVISDPNDLKQVFSAATDQITAGKIYATMLRPTLGDFSLLTMDGKKHLQHRKLLLPPFHGQRMKDYGELMSQITKQQIAHWKPNTTFKLVDEVREIAFNIILSAIFGMNEENTRFHTLASALRNFGNQTAKLSSVITLFLPFLHRNLGFLTPWAKIKKLRKEVDNCLFEEISARKNLNLDSRIDILSLLLQTRDEDGNAMSDQEIRDEMLTLLLTGQEPSTISIAWSFYGILTNPRVLQKLKDELSQCVANDSELISNLDKLVYLDAVIKEALRITPIIPNMVRVSNQPYQLNEYTLPKGTIISLCTYLAHHDPDNWTEPHKFMPERFLNSTENPYTHLPFGRGIKRCIGSAFAQYEMKIIIAQILMHTELALIDNYTTKLTRKGFIFGPSNGLPVKVI